MSAIAKVFSPNPAAAPWEPGAIFLAVEKTAANSQSKWGSIRSTPGKVCLFCIGDRHYRAQAGGAGASAPKHGTGPGGTRRGDGRTGDVARARSQQSDWGDRSERQGRAALNRSGQNRNRGVDGVAYRHRG